MPSYSCASDSSTGVSILQGPHHSAQKSTTTGCVADPTTSSKVAVVTAGRLFDIRRPYDLYLGTESSGTFPGVARRAIEEHTVQQFDPLDEYPIHQVPLSMRYVAS